MKLTQDPDLFLVPSNLHARGWPYRQEGAARIDLADLAEWAHGELDMLKQHVESRAGIARAKAVSLARRAAEWDADEEELRVRLHRRHSEAGNGQSKSAAWRRRQGAKGGVHGQEK